MPLFAHPSLPRLLRPAFLITHPWLPHRRPCPQPPPAGQGAFGNMCRGGHMYAPTKTWRRWHRKINVNQKRYAVVSAIAASALPALVMARGHKIDAVPEVPLVVSDAAGESRSSSLDVVLTMMGQSTCVGFEQLGEKAGSGGDGLGERGGGEARQRREGAIVQRACCPPFLH